MTQFIHNIHLSQMVCVKLVHINNVHRPMGCINLLFSVRLGLADENGMFQ